MRDLRLIGVHDDSEHLVVTDDATGEEYRLRIDEPLRAAARRDRPRLGQLQIAIDNDVRPREVQAMIRAGATADEVSARTGWDLDKIARFEGPVLAEREHVAERARAVRMRGATQGSDQETLGDRSRSRFIGRGVATSSVEWDARRDEEGQWTVSATFTAGGRERNATWWFDPAGMSVVAKNDEAKWLSEADAPDGPVPPSVHRPTAVFDVEVEETRAERANRADPDELIASMREHSGARRRRKGGRKRARDTDPAETDDSLPFEADDGHPPAARGTHAKDVGKQGHSEVPDGDDAATAAAVAPEPAATEPAQDEQSDPGTTSEPPSSSEEDQPTRDTDPPEREEPRDADPTDESTDPGATSDTKSTSGRGRARKGRASVPSWDDVMFGTTRD